MTISHCFFFCVELLLKATVQPDVWLSVMTHDDDDDDVDDDDASEQAAAAVSPPSDREAIKSV